MALSKTNIKTLIQNTLIKFYTDIFKPDLENHTHNYAGSSSAGGSATSAEKVNHSLIIRLKHIQNGTGVTYDGSTSQTMVISPSSIGAAYSEHTHDEYVNPPSYGKIYINDSDMITALGIEEAISFTSGEGINIEFGSTDVAEFSVDISNTGVRSISTGSTNGTISVNTGGISDDIPVKGLGSAAYTNSNAYATSGHTHYYAGASTPGGSANSVAGSLIFITDDEDADLMYFDGSDDIELFLTSDNLGFAKSDHTHSNYITSSDLDLNRDESTNKIYIVDKNGNNINQGIDLHDVIYISPTSFADIFNKITVNGVYYLLTTVTTTYNSTSYSLRGLYDIRKTTSNGYSFFGYNNLMYFSVNSSKSITSLTSLPTFISNKAVTQVESTTKYAGSSSVGGSATSADKVNSSLTIQTNGTSAAVFDGSANKTVNITPTNIGALPLSGGTITGKVILNSNSGLNMANGVDFGAYDTEGTAITLATLTPLNIARFGTTKYETYISTSGELRVVKDYDSSSDGYGNLRIRNIYFRNTLEEETNHLGKIESDTTGAITLSSTNAVILKGHSGYTDSTNCGLEYKRITNSGSSYPVLRPLTTGLARLGTTSLRWQGIYSTTAVDVGSDRRLKEDIVDVNENLENMFMELRPVTYKLKEDNDNRIHSGFIAQEVEECMNNNNISYDEFAALNKSMPDDDIEPKFYTEDGKPDYEYSLKYTEFIPLNTHMIQKAFKRIEELEERILELESK